MRCFDHPAWSYLAALVLVGGVSGFCGWRAGSRAALADHNRTMGLIDTLSTRRLAFEYRLVEPGPGEWPDVIRRLNAARQREWSRDRPTNCRVILDRLDSASDGELRRARRDVAAAERGPGR